MASNYTIPIIIVNNYIIVLFLGFKTETETRNRSFWGLILWKFWVSGDGVIYESVFIFITYNLNPANKKFTEYDAGDSGIYV